VFPLAAVASDLDAGSAPSAHHQPVRGDPEMKMRMHCSSWRAVAPMILALTVLAGLAPVLKHINENCNNNSVAAFWDQESTGNVGSNEINARWEFHTKGATGQASASGFHYNRHGINWRKNFDGSFKYRLNINNIDPGEQVFVGAAFAAEGDFPDIGAGFAVGVLRDIGGLWLGVVSYSNGVPVDFDGVPITQKTGTVDFSWNRANDRVRVTRRGTGESAQLIGIDAWYGALYGTDPLHIAFGAVTYNGNVNFTGANAYLDTVSINYYSRGF
jgi:hypothetical protein